MPRRNRRQRRLQRPPVPESQPTGETPQEAALRLVRTGKCSPAILDSRRLPYRFPGGRRPSESAANDGRL